MSYSEDYFFSETDEVSISACPVLVNGTDENGDTSVWAYYFCFENNSDKKIQLVGRDWNITDDCGNSIHDGAVGFKGEIPELEPGECFEFTGEFPLSSSNAVFYGSCKIVADNEVIEVKMPTFCLSGTPKSRVLN